MNSLFGSPAAHRRDSQKVGRPPWRFRAPHTTAPGTKMWGTIALPGSHNSSEPVINLPASPPRTNASIRAAGVPHVQPQARFYAPSGMTPQPGPSPKEESSQKRHLCSFRCRLAVVVLPASDQPPPSNFFRNQQALLGHVGVVAGLNPLNLSIRNTRGEDSRNPIVVEDENPTALAAWKATSRLRPPLPNGAEPRPQPPPPTPAPDPSTVAAVKESLVRHGAACDVGCCAGDNVLHAQALHVMEKAASEPPTKRRRFGPVPSPDALMP